MSDDQLYLIHIAECITRIRRYTPGGKRRFQDSTLIQDAVLRCLQTMAESTQRLAEEFKSQHPQYDWRSIAGFRNVLVHGYLGVDLLTVWEVVRRDLSKLRTILPPLPRKKATPKVSRPRKRNKP